MLMIDLPKTFNVGNATECQIGDAAVRITWRDTSVFIVESADARYTVNMRIVGMRERDDDQMRFVLCSVDAISTEDHLVG